MIKDYRGIVRGKQTLSKFIAGVEDSQSYPMEDGRSEVLFPFLEKALIFSRGTIEKAAYILTNGALVLITEEKEEIVDVSFVAGKKALKIIFKK